MNADNQSNLLLVRVPYSEEISGHAKLRDYILESLPLGVLVLDENITCEVMELPRLGSVDVVTEPQAPPAQEVTAETSSEGDEKRKILQRLTEYRKVHGLGCLKTVASTTRTKGKINDNTLRMILTGDAPPMPIEDWRRIDRALQRLEEKEAAKIQE